MITVNLDSPEPIEDQIRRGIHTAVARGAVRPGDPLPSVRQLAGDLGVHWNTVARAYRRLRDDGLLNVGRGRTVTVRSGALNSNSSDDIGTLLDTAFTQAKLRGFSYTQLSKTVEKHLKSWKEAWEEG